MNINKTYWSARLKQIVEAKKVDPTLNPMLVSPRLPKEGHRFGEEPKLMSFRDIAKQDPDIVPKIADTLRTFHIAGPESAQPTDPKEFIGMMGERMRKNLEGTLRRHEVLNPEVMQKSPEWYESAHGFAQHLSKKHNIKLDTAAAVIAGLSPSADWNDNAAGAAHHIEFFFKDIPEGRGSWSPEMTSTAQRMVGQNAELRAKKGVTDESEMAKQVGGVHGKSVQDILKGRTSPAEMKDEEFEQLGTLGRIFIDSHHTREMRESLPGGGFGRVMRTATGEPRKLRHQSTDNLAKIYKIMMADSLPDAERHAVHSEALGGGPKVRNFNNNILQPNARPSFVTIDTHTGADAIGDPTETSTRGTALKKAEYPDTSFHKVYSGIIMGGAPKSRRSGNVGVYGVPADVLADIGQQRGLHARQVQSMGWVGRKLDSEAVQADKGTAEEARGLLRSVRTGELSFDQFLKRHDNLIGGAHAKKPRQISWAGQTKESEHPYELSEQLKMVYEKMLLEKSAAWQRKEGKNPSGGLNEKGRKSYERDHPGSDLKRPQPEGGSRRDSFCARMKGMKKKLTSKKTANDPDSRINKSLRKWKC